MSWSARLTLDAKPKSQVSNKINSCALSSAAHVNKVLKKCSDFKNDLILTYLTAVSLFLLFIFPVDGQ